MYPLSQAGVEETRNYYGNSLNEPIFHRAWENCIVEVPSEQFCYIPARSEKLQKQVHQMPFYNYQHLPQVFTVILTLYCASVVECRTAKKKNTFTITHIANNCIFFVTQYYRSGITSIIL